MFPKSGSLFIAVWFCVGQLSYAASLDRVVAVVNDDVITQLELENRLAGVSAEIRAGGGTVPPEDVLRRQMLERMISDKLQTQAAERMGLSVSEQEVDAAVISLASTNNMTIRQLREALAAQGIPYPLFREGLSTQLLINQIYTRRIRNQIVVTDEELDDFVNRGGGNADAREYDVSHILVRIPETASSADVEKARRRVEEAVSRVQQGMDFKQAAATYSDAPDALEGGHLGWREPGQLPELFSRALSEISVGQITKILQSENGFHVLYINDARGVNSTAVPQTHVRHILIRTDEFLSGSEAVHRLEDIRDRIINGEDFGELAKIHSDDTLSATKYGDLGWVMPGELTGSFEVEMNKLREGEVSQPVQSPFGIHLIQVLGRREQNMGEEVTRGRARAQLIEQKAEEKYDEWLRRLRDQSYIEILDDQLKL